MKKIDNGRVVDLMVYDFINLRLNLSFHRSMIKLNKKITEIINNSNVSEEIKKLLKENKIKLYQDIINNVFFISGDIDFYNIIYNHKKSSKQIGIINNVKKRHLQKLKYNIFLFDDSENKLNDRKYLIYAENHLEFELYKDYYCISTLMMIVNYNHIKNITDYDYSNIKSLLDNLYQIIYFYDFWVIQELYGTSLEVFKKQLSKNHDMAFYQSHFSQQIKNKNYKEILL